MGELEIPPSSCVLLVEDDPNDTLVTRRIFTSLGIADVLRNVRDGERAVAYLQGDEPFADRQLYPLPDLVLLDLKMPFRTGLEVLGWARECPHLDRVPIVILTSSLEKGDVERAFELHANAFLVKPGSFRELQPLVRDTLVFWLRHNRTRSG